MFIKYFLPCTRSIRIRRILKGALVQSLTSCMNLLYDVINKGARMMITSNNSSSHVD